MEKLPKLVVAMCELVKLGVRTLAEHNRTEHGKFALPEDSVDPYTRSAGKAARLSGTAARARTSAAHKKAANAHRQAATLANGPLKDAHNSLADVHDRQAEDCV